MCLWGGGRKRRRQAGCRASTLRRGGGRLAEEGDVMQTRILPNSGGEKKISCGKIQQNAIKDKFFIVVSIILMCCRPIQKLTENCSHTKVRYQNYKMPSR